MPLKVQKAVFLFLLTPLLSLGLGGCASMMQSDAYPTLKQTEINVSWEMTKYRTADAQGRLTLEQKKRVNEAYATYRAAFNQALQAAGGNENVTTPENVKALASEVIRVVSTLSVAYSHLPISGDSCKDKPVDEDTHTLDCHTRDMSCH